MTHSVPTRRASELRFEREPLRFETAVSDARVDVEFGEAAVHMIGPALAPLLDEFGAVPVADLRTEPGFTILVDDDLAHRQHDMGMGFGESVGPDVPMDIEVGDHACINELALHKVAGKLDALDRKSTRLNSSH